MKKRRSILIASAVGISLAVILITTFFFGVFVGRHEGRGTAGEFFPKEFKGHGVLGEIQTLGENTLVVKERTGALKTVLIDNQTQIRRGRSSINFTDLNIKEQAVILGEPQASESAIKAKIVRVMGNGSR